MKKFELFALIALAMAACACNKEIEQPGNDTPDTPETPLEPGKIVFTAMAPTKTATADDQTVTWVAGDEVRFSWDGGYTTATAASSGASTTFTIEAPDDATEIYAIYPASAGGSVSDGKVTVHYSGSRTDGSFEANDICVAKAVKNGDAWETSLAFKSAACVLKVGVTSSDIVKIKVEAVGGEMITGAFEVSMDSNGNPVVEDAVGTAGTSSSMVVSGPGNYYIPIKPGVTLTEGFRVSRFIDDENQTIPFYYYGSFTTERGKIIKLDDIDAHAGQYYVTPAGAGTKSGQSWNNAMDAAGFKAFIETNANYFILRGATFHLSAEEFTFGGYLEPDFSGHGETAFTIEGTKSGSDITTFVGGTGDPAGTLWPHSNSNVTVKNVKFTGTNGNSNRAAIRVNNTGVKLQLEDCIFANNKTSGQSGAINLIKGIITITDCEFTGNSASTGASVHVEEATVDISGCTFANNTGKGNALHVTKAAGVVNMEDCDISGGDMCTVYGVNANTVSFSRVNFHDNHAVSESGAAAWLEGAGTYSFKDCNFVDNQADYRGGAIVIASGDVHATFTGGKFQGNHADGSSTDNSNQDVGGSAIYAFGTNVAFDCTNVEFKENYYNCGSNVNAGGIIRVRSSSGLARFNGCVFDGNYQTGSSNLSGIAGSAILLIKDNPPTIYFNACEFKNNYSAKGHQAMVFGLTQAATIAMNNCSWHDNRSGRNSSGNASWIMISNDNANLLISNCSIIGDQQRSGTNLGKEGVIKIEKIGTANLINNILCSNYSDGKSIRCSNTLNLYSYYNKTSPGYDSDTVWDTDTGSGHDYYASSSCFGSWSAPWTWNGTLTGTNSNMKAATADVNTQIQTADADFYAWLNEIGALGKDINGNSRGTTSWPGCFQQ